MLETITHLIEEFGYIIVLLGVMIDSTGIPFPGETILLIGAVAAANSHLSIIGVIICAIIGATVGDNGGYWVGNKFGNKLLSKYGEKLHITQKRRDKVEGYFTKYGFYTVLFGRFFPLLRTFAAFFAGINKLNYKTFVVFNALGAIIWATIIGLLGYFFGTNLPQLEHIIRNSGYIFLGIFIVIILIIVCIIIFKRVNPENK